MLTIVGPETDLSQLALRINACHHDVISAVRKSLEHARDCGEHLLEAKAALGHGKWLDWLDENVEFSDRTAQNYMRVAESWEQLKEKTQETADLTMERALQLLTEQKKHEMKPSFPATSTTTQIHPTYELHQDSVVVEDEATGEKIEILSMSPRPNNDDCIVTLTQVVQRLEHLIDQVTGDKEQIMNLVANARTALDQIEKMLA